MANAGATRGERDHRPHGPHCGEHRRSPETSGPSSPEATRPPTLATGADATPPQLGVLVQRLTLPAGRHAMVVAHFFESGRRRRLLLGRVRERTAKAGQ